MTKVNYYNLSEKERAVLLNDMFAAVAQLETAREVEKFFRDLLTLSELVMLSRRIQIAKMLLAGQTYGEIIEDLGVGTSTIIQVERWLSHGFGGYRQLVKKARAQNRRIDRHSDFEFTFDDLRHKYPAHFWLINMFLDK